MATWIKMPLGMEVGLGPIDFVLDGDPAPPPQKGAKPSNFKPMSIVAKRLDGSTWHTGGPRSRLHYARWGPSSPPQKGSEFPQFSAHF